MIINGESVTFSNGAYNYFACTCAEKDREFWENELLAFNEYEYVRLPASGLFMWLEHEYDAWVTSVNSDMWFGISVENKDHMIHVQCDFVEYGLLAAIKIFEMLEKKDD